MIRICTSVVDAGYDVLLIGTRHHLTSPLQERTYRQKRIFTFFRKGFGFYAEYNLCLFFYLLFKKAHLLCCIDLDTMLPVWLASKIKHTKRVYDAHEYFSQQKEIVSRPFVYRFWHWIEKKFVHRFSKGYVVSGSIAAAFKKNYGVDYEVIRNMPLLKPLPNPLPAKEKIILYQGAVNEARGLEFLVPAMKDVNALLFIYGDGNFLEQTKKMIASNNLADKVLLKGKLLPWELESITATAYIGLNLVEAFGQNQFFSLANKFFDYMHAGVPQLTMNFPEYKNINEDFEVAVLIDDLQTNTIAAALNRLLNDEELYHRLQQNCLKAREILNWQNEEKRLDDFYKRQW